MTAYLLEQAETLAEEFCQQLQQLLEQARRQQRSLEIDARQLHRLLDELEVRLRLAESGTSPIPTHAERMQGKREEIYQEQQQILEELGEAQEAANRLELFLRQVEMSGRSLRREIHLQPYDPWELALRSQVLYGRERERCALAREVHDGPAQVLSNLILGLEQCRQDVAPLGGQTAALAERLLRDSRLGIQEVRRFIYDLRPSPVAAEPLGRQLERFVRDLQGTYQIKVELRWGEPPRPLSAEETVSIYRIAQEALLNARRHARAKHIDLTASCEPTSWMVTVSDDGIGFDPSVACHGEDQWGIAGMRERAALIGAELSIESDPGKGTTVLLRLPIDPSSHAKQGGS